MRLRQLFAFIAASLVATVNAQFPGMGQLSHAPDIKYMPTLLMETPVQRDLGISPEVAQKAQSILLEVGMAMMPYIGNSAKGSPSPEKQKQMTHALMHALDEMQTRTAALLTPPQRVRLHQLTLQAEGPTALLQPANASAVGLTPPQKTRLSQMITASSTQAMSGMKNFDKSNPMSGFGDVMKRQKEAQAAMNSQLPHILTPSQMRKWNQMQGRKLPNLSMMPGGLGM